MRSRQRALTASGQTKTQTSDLRYSTHSIQLLRQPPLTTTMATISPQRPSRRAAASRRNVILEESDDEPANATQNNGAEDSDGEDFTPAPKRSPRKSTRRKTTADVAPTPRTSRGRRTKTDEGIEPSQIFDPEESTVPPEPVSPTKKASPRKRKSVATTRKSRNSISNAMTGVPDLAPPLPTPAPSVSPEPEMRDETQTVLGDITNAKINEQPTATMVDVQKAAVTLESTTTVLERPMDIVLKSRSVAPPIVEEPTGPKARMVITHLILHNFKSYAGKQMVGPFHVSFSSVVGPNGSGKSNVIDSLLFVFGFRASKMRQGKISALIHNSANFPNLEFCEVEVHFQEVMDLVSFAYFGSLRQLLTSC
jgi:structural maintenance of chromosome 4